MKDAFDNSIKHAKHKLHKGTIIQSLNI